MTNKEIKVGSKVWLNTYDVSREAEAGYIVSSVKKDKTLVTVVADAPVEYGYKENQITMYGHASSSLLSGYDRRWGSREFCYTCDYSIIEEKTKWFEHDEKLKDAGRALLNFVSFFK